MTTHSSILAWKIPWTEEAARQSMRLQRVRHNWETRWQQQHLKLTQQRKSIIVKKKKKKCPQKEPFCCRCFAVASLPSDSSEIFPYVMALFCCFASRPTPSKFSLVKIICRLSCLKGPTDPLLGSDALTNSHWVPTHSMMNLPPVTKSHKPQQFMNSQWAQRRPWFQHRRMSFHLA